MVFQVAKWPRWLRDFVPLLAWLSLIFILSAQPVLVEIDDEVSEKFFYKLAHVGAYAVLAWLWWRALAPQRQGSWPLLLAAAGLATLYGVSDEVHQLFVPGRHGRVADVLFDASGAILMILLLRHCSWLRRFPESWPLSAGLRA
jgi:VanZ family protein